MNTDTRLRSIRIVKDVGFFGKLFGRGEIIVYNPIAYYYQDNYLVITTVFRDYRIKDKNISELYIEKYTDETKDLEFGKVK